MDHSGANQAFKELSGAQIRLLPVQEKNYPLIVIEGARLFGMTPAEFTRDSPLDGSSLVSGDIKLELLPAPGHSPDCVCFYDRSAKILACGDVLFELNTGRVDLPGGNPAALIKSIEELSRLEIEYLLPGHMGIITGAARIAANFDYIKTQVLPFL